MVSKLLMKYLRSLIPFFGTVALVALFFKLPETPDLFDCASCTSNDPYFPLFAAGYFTSLIAIALIFPEFPSKATAWGGILWSILLTFALTYLAWSLCVMCLIAHLCNILIWVIWLITSQKKTIWAAPLSVRVAGAVFAPMIMLTLFASLNLTFMVYDFRLSQPQNLLKPGDILPHFAQQGIPLCINFITPDCPYCKKQLPLLHKIALNCSLSTVKFINITPFITEELVRQHPSSQWIEDKDGKLKTLFKVQGYPTLFLADAEGKIKKIIAGMSEELKSEHPDFPFNF
jgi:thiol-disulfide isomerase/thioredoxin